MLLRGSALALLAFLALPAPGAVADETAAQKLFRKRLLNDSSVSKTVKQTLRNGGFVDRKIRFADLTGDTKSDAVLTVNQGGTAGRIALYVYSSHGVRMDDDGSASPLRIAYRHERLYRARARLRKAGEKRPNGAILFRRPIFDAGDTLADPAAWREVELRWRQKRKRFRRARTEVIDNVDSRYCSRTGDFCTRTLENKRGATYLELSSPSVSGRYTICVTTPAGNTDCQLFTLRRSGNVFLSRIRWAANFPNEGRGRYSVVWRLRDQQLGPALGFRRPK